MRGMIWKYRGLRDLGAGRWDSFALVVGDTFGMNR